MAILTTSGRTALAIAVAAQPLHLAWGTGDPAWDTTPEPLPTGATALVAEIGRRSADIKKYCLPDAAGELTANGQRFKESVLPTNYLYLQFNFDYADAPSAMIREIGVFLGTVPKLSVPPGQIYLVPADIQATGTLMLLERPANAIPRSSAIEQSFKFVLEL